MKRLNLKFIAVIALMVFISINSFAIPALQKKQTIKQINGKELTFTIKGDESVNWALSIDSYTLIHNREGNFVYAQLSENGDLVPSNFLAVNPEHRTEEEKTFLSTLPYNLFFSENQIKEMKENFKLSANGSNTDKFPTVGQTKLLVILVEFSDKAFTFPQTNFDNMCNQIGYNYNGATGSAKEYFYDNSSGRMDAEFDVVGPVTLPNTSLYYAGNSMQNMSAFVNTAITLADPLVDYADYDNDNDGVVDNVHFIFAGTPKSSTGNNDEIWPHASRFYQAGLKDQRQFRRYSCSAEKRSSVSMDGIGTLCHETSHIFGLPDFYDTDYQGSGGEMVHPETWDIMASGGYNNNSNTPPYYHAYERELVNWGSPITLNANTDCILPALKDTMVAYKIYLSANEFLMLEHRKKEKWDAYVPTQGLLIIHADQNRLDLWPGGNNINVDPNDKGLFIKTATGNASDNQTANAVFPGNVNNTLITAYTNPAISLKNGTIVNNKPISHIRYINDSTMSFKFMSDIPQTKNNGVISSSINAISADVKGAIIYSGASATIIEKGFYYHTSADSVNETYGTKVLATSNDSLINTTLTSLSPSTMYFYRPFASTQSGTDLGEIMNLTTTDGLGVIITGLTSNIGNTQADISGTLISKGDGTFIEKGIVLTSSATDLPTINDIKVIINDSSTGVFNVTAQGLTEQTTYYYRAFITSSYGTRYGTRRNFTTTFPEIFDNIISSTQDYCEIGTPTQITGLLPTGGRGNFTYLWEEKKLNTDWTAASQTNNTQNYQPETLNDSTFYRRIVFSDGTLKDTSNIISVNINRTWAGELIGSRDTIIENTPTGTIRLMNYKGSIINWERKKDNEDWTVISHTGVTYNDTPTSEGEYRYRVNVQLGTCQSKYSSEKIIEVLNSSSIDDISLDINLSIYPNPNNGSFRITSNEENTVNLQIINSLGQVVLNENTKIDNKEINIQGLNNGTYFLRILSNNKTINKKLIINK